MIQSIDRTAAVGLGNFGEKAIQYVQKQGLKNITLVAGGKMLTSYPAPKPENPETRITQTVLYIADLAEAFDLKDLDQYKPDFEVNDLFKITVVLLPAGTENYTSDIKLHQSILNFKEVTDSVVLVPQNNEEGDLINSPEAAIFQAVKSLNDVITRFSEVNVDFEDVKTVLDGKLAMIGTAEGSGADRALKVAEQATDSPLMQQFYGSTRILLSISSGSESELEMDELTTITDYIQDKFGEESEILFGHGIEDELGNRITALVITAIPAQDLVSA